MLSFQIPSVQRHLFGCHGWPDQAVLESLLARFVDSSLTLSHLKIVHFDTIDLTLAAGRTVRSVQMVPTAPVSLVQKHSIHLANVVASQEEQGSGTVLEVRADWLMTGQKVLLFQLR